MITGAAMTDDEPMAIGSDLCTDTITGHLKTPFVSVRVVELATELEDIKI